MTKKEKIAFLEKQIKETQTLINEAIERKCKNLLNKSYDYGFKSQPSYNEIERLFGNMGSMTKEELEEEYRNKINNFYNEAKKPIEEVNKSNTKQQGSFLESLTDEEQKEYQRRVKEFNKQGQ